MAIGDKGLSVTKAGAGKKGLSLKFSFNSFSKLSSIRSSSTAWLVCRFLTDHSNFCFISDFASI